MASGALSQVSLVLHRQLGLLAERVETIGRLAHYVTRAGYGITPVIGIVQPPLALKPNEEVAEIFELSLEAPDRAAQRERARELYG